MLPVRELSELARRLDAAMFEQQMGPFALVQRPPPDSRVEESKALGQGATSVQPALKLRGGAPLAMDFGDLMVATLPPPDEDGFMELVIGRSPDCDLVVEDVAVSKKHAVVSWAEGKGVLRELGSINGVFVNDHRIKDTWTLRDNDALRFGQSHFIFLLAATFHRRMRTTRGG